MWTTFKNLPKDKDMEQISWLCQCCIYNLQLGENVIYTSHWKAWSYAIKKDMKIETTPNSEHHIINWSHGICANLWN